MHRDAARAGIVAATLAGLVAGVVSTLVQVVLWAAFTEPLPSILFRDSRLAAAIVLGAEALHLPDHDLRVIVVATLVHFALSIAYAFAIGWLVDRRGALASLSIGAAAGAAIYALDMHVATAIWPWFAAARDPITFIAHLAFGVSAAWTYRRLVAVIGARTPSA